MPEVSQPLSVLFLPCKRQGFRESLCLCKLEYPVSVLRAWGVLRSRALKFCPVGSLVPPVPHFLLFFPSSHASPQGPPPPYYENRGFQPELIYAARQAAGATPYPQLFSTGAPSVPSYVPRVATHQSTRPVAPPPSRTCAASEFWGGGFLPVLVLRSAKDNKETFPSKLSIEGDASLWVKK